MLVGQTLRGRFKIVKQLGSGAFGDTYLAVDLDYMPQRQCVVKHLSPKNADPQSVAIAQRLFKEEAKSLSILGEYERIPRLYSYFEQDAEFYLVQEFIAGHSLDSEFKSGKKWSETQTINLLTELLEVLAVVHQANKIHRDIKPANIMRRQDGQLFLIDFGAVKEIVTVDRDGKTNIRASGLTVGIGTYYFMAPEQAQGKPQKASDIYAVGRLAIMALTGLSFAELDDLPIDPDRFMAVLAQQDVKISHNLETVLRRMIQFNPDKRYVDATAALEALTPKPSLVKKILLPAVGAIAIVSAIWGGNEVLGDREQPVNIDYSGLETALQAKKWSAANQKTIDILDVVKQDKAIAEIPCEPLVKMDRLWVDSSDGRFGFAPQKQVYLETGNEIDNYVESSYQQFGDRVGWRTFGYWSLFGDLMFSERAPLGHLPTPSRESDDLPNLNWRERQKLLTRVDRCGI